MIDNTNCYIELPSIRWDKQTLIDIMRSYSTDKWVSEGYVNKYLRPDSHPVFDDLYKQLEPLEINIGRVFFAELSPHTFLQPHTDQHRKASINFPLIGDWDKSPVKFHSERSIKSEHLVCEHTYRCPTIINTTINHSVINPTNETRYLFCLSLYDDWETIQLTIDKIYSNIVK
jgi:hypothetical protein